ncbi:MAG TPA: peptidase S10 [Microvirga sp.]|jgi:carboxypeptidase C (cathepsin A)|nr:peptidase S10 [Microvirga sp.]
MLRSTRLGLAAALLLSLAAPSHVQAQDPRPQQGEQRRPEGQRLPPESVTQHRLSLPGRTLAFTATAGHLTLTDQNGAPQAEYGFTAYTLDGAEPGTRPVTFAINGGPGASSAYLHLLAFGPWRLPIDGPSISPSMATNLVPNAETWLDFTDLVFVDPPGTGYARVIGGDPVRERFFSVEGDIDGLAAFVTRWVKEKNRLDSPKFFTGESYGGFRGPLLAQKLQTDQGVGLSGLVLVSPVLDFGWFAQPNHAPWVHVTRLPSMAAAALEARGEATREALRAAEAYASGEYLTDLMRGLQDKEAAARVGARVAELTGLDPALVRRLAGRIDTGTFQREFRRQTGQVVSAYDTGISGYDPDPTAAISRFEDPGLEGFTAPLTTAVLDHLGRTLKYRAEGRYEVLNGGVNGAWRWGRGRGQPESVSELRQALALDSKLRVLVAHGFTDLVTPYYASQLLLNQLPDLGPRPRASLQVYGGGHMFYTRDPSRQAFRADAERMFQEALRARAENGG